MGLLVVKRYTVSGLGSGVGQQTVEDELTLPTTGTVTVYFDYATWEGARAEQPYTIFTYASLTGSASTLSADATDLQALGFNNATFQDTGPVSGVITVTFN